VYTTQYLYCLWVKRGKHVIGNLDVINRDIAPIFIFRHWSYSKSARFKRWREEFTMKKIVIKTAAVIFVSLIKSSSLNLLFFCSKSMNYCSNLSLKTKKKPPIKQASRIFFWTNQSKDQKTETNTRVQINSVSRISWTEKLAGQKANGTQVDVQK
jgi:hypothetical protein